MRHTVLQAQSQLSIRPRRCLCARIWSSGLSVHDRHAVFWTIPVSHRQPSRPLRTRNWSSINAHSLEQCQAHTASNNATLDSDPVSHHSTAPSARGLNISSAVDNTRRQVLVASLVACLVTAVAHPAAKAAVTADAVLLERVSPQVAPAQLTQREQQIINVFNQASRSVVNIYDVTLVGRVGNNPEVDVPEGNGSGVIWDTSGNVLTNYHVLGNSIKSLGAKALGSRVALVQLLGRSGRTETYEGTLVGLDRARDMAVVRINVAPEELQPVTLGSSSQLKVGQQVLAIGCPFGFDHTLSTGVVSGLNREIRSLVGTTIPGGIQTDAAINPGNSGGPLLNSSGQLVGINTAIFTNTGTSVGIGFAIPVDAVARLVPQLIASGKVTRPSLGVQVATEQIASRLKVNRGALLQAVNPDGAAQKAGLLPTRRGLSGIITGDVILQVDDLPVNTPPDLINALDVKNVGQEVTMRVLRTGDQGSQEITVRAILGSE